MRPSLKDASCECLDESFQTAKKRENIEITLTINETARYGFIEYGCLCKDKKTSNENGDRNDRSVITMGVTRYL
ncbi:hypothetical protein [Methanosarcina barkeri]|uniref:hypothetical protein n=1 Tax=Methanosarcina barkeri TaxID=2208 RepID=UPI00003C62C5|nr:hypothetical protein [Methanosarcina barkeri]